MEKTSKTDVRWLHNHPISWHRPWASRRLLKYMLAVTLVVFCVRSLSFVPIDHYLPIALPSEKYLNRGAFSPITISGFANTGNPGHVNCADLKHEGQIQVQQSFFLDDDLIQIAKSLEHHPMIDYSGQDKKLTYEETIQKTWLKLAQSSVWLQKYGVFLTITRVMFYDKGVKNWAVISFLRGQIYDEDWNELKDYTIKWQGESITFPTVFDIPTPYNKGGGFYGPEDPRIIIEEGVEDAEPVIIFNMINDVQRVTRAMHIFRPFSNDSSVLTIVDQKERPQSEKNWMPFFHKELNEPHEGKQWPSHHLHFIHSFKPLRILKCHLLNGWCEWAYLQKIPEDFAGRHNDTKGRMSGGTNFVPLALDAAPGLHAYVGFPRTHIDAGCTHDSMYRPELMIMTAYGSHFHLDYMSDAIDFGYAALDQKAIDDPCGEGRILIANSIAKWDRKSRQDVMTLSFTVDDSTTQILRLHGVWDFIQRLPHLRNALRHDSSQGGQTLWDLRWSAVGNDVLACSVEAAQNYSINAAAPYNGTDLRKQREKAEEKAREEAKKQKEEAEKMENELKVEMDKLTTPTP